MPADNKIRDLIDGLVACDEQPNEERMAELRKSLEQTVTKMKQRGRRAQFVCAAAIVLMILGYVIIAIAAGGHQTINWLAKTGFAVLILGAILAVVGAVGLFLFRGFGYVWARHDLHDAAIMELSLQVHRLSERLDALGRNS